MNSPIRRGLLVLAALLFALTAPGCDSDSPTAPLLTEGDVTPVELYASSTSGLDQSERRVVRTEAAYDELAMDIFDDDPDAEALPMVDFTRFMVLAVASGEQPEACHSIAVTGATSDGTDLDVTVTETGPTADCMCAASLAQPVQVVSVPRADEISFRTVTATDCAA